MPKNNHKVPWLGADEIVTFELPDPQQTISESSTEADIKILQFTATHKTTKKEIQTELRTYGLSVTGNRAELLERLKVFAQDRKGWYNIFWRQVSRQRGSMTGKRAQTQIAHRIESQFPQPDAIEGFQPRKGKSKRPIHPMPLAQLKKFDLWTEKVLLLAGDIQGPPGTSTPMPSLEAVAQGSTISTSNDVTKMITQLQQDIGIVRDEQRIWQQQMLTICSPWTMPGPLGYHPQAGFDPSGTLPNDAFFMPDVPVNEDTMMPSSWLEDQFQHQLSFVENIPEGTTPPISVPTQGPHHPSRVVPPPETLAPAPPTSSTSAPSSSAMQVSFVSNGNWLETANPSVYERTYTEIIPRNAIPMHRLGVLMLSGGHEIFYDMAVTQTIRDPPAQHFSQRISDLFTEWHVSNLVELNGQGVPVREWPLLYNTRKSKLAKTGQWRTVSKEWHNWKRIVDEKERLGSEAAFWERFTDQQSGKRRSYKYILQTLQSAQGDQDKRDMDDALRYFNGDLANDPEGRFVYQRGVTKLIVSKPGKVASIWREILDTDDEVAARWEALNGDMEEDEHDED